MNDILRRIWPAIGVAVLALYYIWIGIVAHGWDRILGLAGGVVILAAIVAARQAMPGAYALLVIGALPLAIVTWWSIATPVLAIVVLVLGWIAVRHLRRPRHGPTSTAAASESAA
jgi:hypothetical protein